jgi:hypothetical protein
MSGDQPVGRIRFMDKQRVNVDGFAVEDAGLGLGATGGAWAPQVLLAGGAAGDDELLGVLLRALPGGVAAGRANVGGVLAGSPVGHRYAVALGLALGRGPG